jgi:hypothetical protein
MGAGWNVRRVYQFATGKYFKWAAADDILEPEFLRRCVEPSIRSYVFAKCC